jgi:hypothetical protein
MNQKRFVIASRTMLVMLVIAAAALLGLGVAALTLIDPPETAGSLRTAFGTVFGVVAFAVAAVLGIPSGVGLWAMAGATRQDVEPALPHLTRVAFSFIAIGTVAVTTLVLLLTGSTVTMLNVGLLLLIALGSLGLAGAVSYSPHRARAIGSAIALVLVVLGTAWVLGVLLATPGR